jgi:hypothetical protein
MPGVAYPLQVEFFLEIIKQFQQIPLVYAEALKNVQHSELSCEGLLGKKNAGIVSHQSAPSNTARSAYTKLSSSLRSWKVCKTQQGIGGNGYSPHP